MRLSDDATEGYHKELSGHRLAFDFDEHGELTMLRGRGGVTLVLTPVGGDDSDRKIVRSRRLEADFDPASGDLVEARCTRTVEFEQGDVRATADEGIFRTVDSKLTLEKSPRLWDPRASLEAQKIVVDIDSGNVEGLEEVRSSSAGEPGAAGLFPSTEKEPVYFVADHLVYDRSRELAVYTGAARGFQGQSRVEADRIEIFQKTGDLLAEGAARTVFLQKLVQSDDGDADSPIEPTVTSAESLHYRAEGEVLEYRVGVEMRSGKMTLRGDSVDVRLMSGGSGVQEVYAEGEVEIRTADGKAAGHTARYLPDEQSMTVEGEEAWLENDGKLTEGKQLTFFLSNDRILVDGREQNRTKTTYSSKPRPF
jgi:lipopolysaccharide export system protein LptA